MIKIEDVVTMSPEQLMTVIKGTRNPMNSWSRIDSEIKYENVRDNAGCLEIGSNDHELMMKLAKAGPVHGKYRRMITVYVDITAPLYWWKEFDTYKVGTVANSCSTMHKIHEKEFTMDDFSHEHLIPPLDLDIVEDANFWNDAIDSIQKSIPNDTPEGFTVYSDEDTGFMAVHNHCKVDIPDGEFFIIGKCATVIYTPKEILEFYILPTLNANRKAFLKTKDKKYWWQMIQLLPSSYNQKRTVMLNYEVLAGMYEYRHDHKLDEWRDFCKWIESLPYSELITGERKGEA